MPKQFLLNPDGSVPAGTNLQAILNAGIPLVLPTPIPRTPGMIAIEQDPAQDENGVWRQVWVEVLAPPSATEE